MKDQAVGPQNLSFICQFSRRETAIELNQDKAYLINSRLSDVARQVGAAGADEVVQALRTAPTEQLRQRVISALTTNETLFFRDHYPFETLRDHVFPELLEKNRDSRRLRIWSAACSSGQEPYTLAMLAVDLLTQYPEYQVEIVATDVDRQILERAQEGKYKRHEIGRGLPARYMARFFERSGATWQVDSKLSRLVRFEHQNLAGPWPKREAFDLVLMRNVLIYFGRDTKQDILVRAAQQLSEGGLLMLGAGETVLGYEVELQRIGFGPTSFYARPQDHGNWRRIAS